MKKSVLIVFSIFLSLTIIFLVQAATLPTASQVQANAQSYITSTTKYCSPPPAQGQGVGSTLQEWIYTALSTGLCAANVSDLQNSQGSNAGCFPAQLGSAQCNIQSTAQAALALYMTNSQKYSSTIASAQNWLLSQNTTSPNVQWYLQLDSLYPMKCSLLANPADGYFNITMSPDKKLTQTNDYSGPCFSIGPNGYWVDLNTANPGCRTVSYQCNQSYAATTLYQWKDTNTGQVTGPIYVEGTSNTYAANGRATINGIAPSYCIAGSNGGSCSYDNTAWTLAALAKSGVSYSTINEYIPYLELAYNNEPLSTGGLNQDERAAFLYALTGDSNALNTIEGDINLNYEGSAFGSTTTYGNWGTLGSADRYFETGLIYLLAGSNLGSTMQTEVKNWFYNYQASDGSWGDNGGEGTLIDTALAYYALFNQPPSHQLIQVPVSNLVFNEPTSSFTISDKNYNYAFANVSYLGVNVKNITIYLYNSTGLQEKSSTTGQKTMAHNFTGLINGNYVLNATVYNKLNQRNSTNNISFSVQIPTNLIMQSPSSDRNLYDRNYTFVNVSYTGLNLKNITIYLYNSTGLQERESYSNFNPSAYFAGYNFTGLTNGVYYVNATSYDVQGNENTTITRKITVAIPSAVQFVPPTPFISPPPGSGSTLNVNHVGVNTTFSGLAKSFEITISVYNATNGALVDSKTNDSSPFFWNITNLNNGLYYINATAADEWGDKSQQSIALQVSVPNPTSEIKFLSPPTPVGSIALGQNFLPVKVNFTGGSFKNLTVYLYNSSGLVNSSFSNTSKIHFVNYTGLPPGEYYINASSYDTNNDLNSTETRSVYLYSTSNLFGGSATRIGFVAPTPNNSVQLQQTFIPVTVLFQSLGSASLSSMTIYLYNSTSLLQENTSNSATNLVTFNYTHLAAGIYKINATSTDSSGNKNSTETRTIYLLAPPASGGSSSSGGSSNPAPQPSCGSQGYYCLTTTQCGQAGGNNMIDYGSTCQGLEICCNKNLQLQTCSEQQGQVCTSSQICSGGSTVSASDTASGQACCLGTCTTPQQSSSTCSSLGGICRTSCSNNEAVSSSGTCSLSSQTCCIPGTSQPSQNNNTILIVILAVLIVLAALGIIFRKKLSELWLKMKSKSKGGKGNGGMHPFGPGRPPAMPPGGARPGPYRGMPSRPMPQRGNHPAARAPVKPRQNNSDVLNKLKEMGK